MERLWNQLFYGNSVKQNNFLFRLLLCEAIISCQKFPKKKLTSHIVWFLKFSKFVDNCLSILTLLERILKNHNKVLKWYLLNQNYDSYLKSIYLKLKLSYRKLWKDKKRNYFWKKNYFHFFSWSRQGVLLLDTCLTVREGYPSSHDYQLWDQPIKGKNGEFFAQ